MKVAKPCPSSFLLARLCVITKPLSAKKIATPALP